MAFDFTLLGPTTSATEFEYRCGPGGAATVTFNGKAAARLMGGIFNSFIAVEEIQT